ncbi:bacillopeptidase F [Folsomia candida]|uniref:Bacillopeptidase F n=1 Tax=Folsomia candida TaxID=158441 RepID=A0A226EWG5_FOLCA|nr:bacillopeptidase F [Folsomia candida]OXA61995.1 Bacillopeptidase F [Folsomia candida]
MKLFILLAATIALAFAGRVDINLATAVQNGETTAILQLPQIMAQVEANPALRSLSGDAKVTALVASLQGLTSAAQAPYVSVANSLGLETKQFWSSNIILVKGLTPEKLSLLEATPGDFTLRKQHTFSAFPTISHGPAAPLRQGLNQWGVNKIRAPEAWNRTRGEGIVVAIIDTGVNVDHVALKEGYAGAWADPHYNTPGPTDVDGHGSHCAGTVLGTTNGVGVAPGAKWIACRGLNHQGDGGEASMTTCAEFVLTANPKPHIVSNSWGGRGGSTFFNPQISAWRAAGIIPVFAIGNSGPNCRTAGSPGDQPNLIAVGNTDEQDAVAIPPSNPSSRGPSSTGLLKPDVSAPGTRVVSCGTSADNYVTYSGTSMACPHTAGAIALLLSANPTWGYDEVYAALTTSGATPQLTTADRGCGLPGAGDFPNNAFGHGRIDVAAALGL